MKNVKIILVFLIVVAVGLFAFRNAWQGSVKGTIVPADGAVRAWALSSTDTFRTNVAQVMFEITGVKPGIYRIIIEANAPYKNQAKDSVQVTDGAVTDVGTITLLK
jgi:hypothetical protein